jgi:hypothetical protein
MAQSKTTAENLIERFDAGEDVSDYFDMTKATRPNREKERVNVDLPKWMIRSLDRQAGINGVTRQAIIKLWLSERLKDESKAA